MLILQKTMVLLTMIARRKYFLLIMMDTLWDLQMVMMTLMVVTQGVTTLIILKPCAHCRPDMRVILTI